MTDFGVIGELYAENAKKIPSVNLRLPQNASHLGRTTVSAYSIADMIADVKNEKDGNAGVYYVNKKALVSGRNNHKELLLLDVDGFVHSIHESKSPVNAKHVKQTDTPQFTNFIKGSVFKNEDGSPIVMYRGGEDISVFDRKKSRPSNLYGRGFYFTADENHAAVYGDVHAYYPIILNWVDNNDTVSFGFT